MLSGGPSPFVIVYVYLRLNSAYSGTTRGNVRQNFYEAERGAYDDHIVPAFSRFLRKCYSELHILLVSEYTTYIFL